MKKKKKRRNLGSRRGPGKGAGFERMICKALSLWVSHGSDVDLFWRSAMSGGRATQARKKGISVRQSGDICAQAPEAHVLTDAWFMECKFRKDLQFDFFLLRNKGILASFWNKARAEARHYERTPVLIVKQNGYPIVVIGPRNFLKKLLTWHGADRPDTPGALSMRPLLTSASYEVWLFNTITSMRFPDQGGV